MKKIQLSIPEPCHEHWDNMAPTQQGRYCNACAKEVIDFSEMSDTEVLNYFSKLKNEKVCGHAWPDQLDRAIEATPKKKFYWYLNYVIAFILLIGKANSSKAQGRKGMMIPKSAGAVNRANEKNESAKTLSIEGVIKDEKGQPIPFASVKLMDSNYGVKADENGRYSVKVDSLGGLLQISSISFKTKQVQVNDVAENDIVLERSTDLMKEVVILTAPFQGRLGGMMVSYTVSRRRIIKDSIANWISVLNPAIKIYPNPVPKNATFTVALKLKNAGSYTLQITDAAGRLMEARTVNAVTKEQQLQLQSSNRGAGVYYIRVLDEKGKSAGTGILVIQ